MQLRPESFSWRAPKPRCSAHLHYAPLFAADEVAQHIHEMGGEAITIQADMSKV